MSASTSPRPDRVSNVRARLTHVSASPPRSDICPPDRQLALPFAVDRAQRTELQRGDRVYLDELVACAERNGMIGTLVRFHDDVMRWQVVLDDNCGTVRCRPCNVRRDRIEIVDVDGGTMTRLRPAWPVPDDAAASANLLLMQQAMAPGRTVRPFLGHVLLFEGCSAREHKPPSVVVLPSDAPLWDESAFMEALRARLDGTETSVDFVAVEWDAVSDKAFSQSLIAMIAHAHATDGVYVALRTRENTSRFAMLHALSGANDDTTRALLGRGAVFCAPTEAIVFHRDNMVKLPTSMSLEQAIRIASGVVTDGIEHPCPICLNPPSSSESTIFLPCECKATVHLSCYTKMQREGVTKCPLCRGVLSNIDAR